MTLHELLDEVKTFTATSVPEPQIIALLNRAMVRIARDLGIPKVHIDVNNVTGEFELTTATVGYDVRDVVTAHRDDTVSTQLPIISAFEADRLNRNWRNLPVGRTQFLIYDPAVLGLGTSNLLPVPLPDDPESYVLACIVRPTLMSALDDEPFDGLIPEYHQMLSHYVISDLMVMVGNNEGAQFHLVRYHELRRDAHAYSRPDGAVLPTTSVSWSVNDD